MNSSKMTAGATFPAMHFEAVGGKTVDPAAASGWRVLIVYRGKHCPLCKKYLGGLNEMLGDFESAGVSVMTVSADTKEKAEADVKELGWKFPVGYGLTMEQMRTLGVYISNPRSPEETDRPFSEPAVFVINPEGKVQIVDVSNAPFARPDLGGLLKGLQFVMSKRYPVRGTA
ncbi:MAG: AhpC/TSA family protein [Pseudomonadota bacterium]|nr:AhpC/TSA family protein [Pseudomonadota bacterium]